MADLFAQRVAPNKGDPLHSTDAIKVARELTNIQFQEMKASNDPDYEIVGEKLKTIRDCIWAESGNRTKPNKSLNAEQTQALFNRTVAELTPAQKPLFLESYARMGNLYEMSSMTARSNYLHDLSENPNKVPPGGVEEFAKEYFAKSENTGKIDNFIDAINKPVFEMTFTAHPTNVYSIEAMQAYRNVAKVLHDKKPIKVNADGTTREEELTLEQAVKEYQETPLLKTEKGVPANLTVREETNNMLYFIRNVYHDLPDLYTIYDKALKDHAGNAEFDKTKLQLKTRFSSWGSSGDKDGNKNVTAETTLEAIALHTKTALEMYGKDLANIPELKKWKDLLLEKQTALKPILEEIQQLTEDEKASMGGKSVDSIDLNNRFDTLSKKLVEIREGLNSGKFTEELTKSAKENDKALALLRRFRTFGFSFGKIEYRETAEEYARVVEAILGDKMPNYESLTPEEKANSLSRFLTQNGNTAAKFFADHKDKIIEGAGKKYSDKDAMPIAYHSIKRMALARDFPDMIENNVLAECGALNLKDEKGKPIEPTPEQAANQGVANLLEAQFLQLAVEENGKRAKLGIIPLFEEANTIKNADKILGAAYNNPAYKEQLKLLQGDATKPTQQVQIAHSDNARRSGVQAARGFIHDAHKKLRKVGEENNIQTQFFEGGSISDMYRNGVRAISANVNAFGLHEFSKFTFQGGDLPNYFNHPESTLRILDRSIAHQASHIEGFCEEEKKPNDVIDDVAIKAMTHTYDDYQKNDFDAGESKDKETGIVSYAKDNLHRLLALLDYKAWTEVANAGSRAAKRTEGGEVIEKPKLAFAKATSLGVGAIDSAGVDMRTIGFSMTQQVGGMLPTWVGSVNLAQYLNEEVAKKYEAISQKGAENADEQEFLEKLKPDKDGKLNPQQIRLIYEKSPAFRDGQDKAGAGCLISDLDTTKKLMINHLKNYYIKNVDWAAEKLNPETDGEAIANKAQEAAAEIIEGYKYWNDKAIEYKNAANLSYSALNNKPVNVDMANFGNKQIVDKMRECFRVAGSTTLLDDKFGYRDILFNYRLSDDKLLDIDALADKGQMLTSRLWAAAMQMFSHGRWLPFSDPSVEKERANSR